MKWKKIYRSILTSLILLLCSDIHAVHKIIPTPAAKKNHIIWTIRQQLWFHTTSGPFKNKGLGDIALAIAMETLKNYTHETINATNQRAMTTANKQLSCISATGITKERAEFYHFSKIFFINSEQAFVFPKRHAAIINKYKDTKNQVDLIKLALNENLTMAFISKTSNGREGEQVIEILKKRHLVYERFAQFEPDISFVKMIKKNRFDFFTGPLLPYFI